MALLPSTAETRMVPVAGRQFAERRLMRGVGAAERAVGNAWGRLTSRQREYYGNQRNFAGGLQREATRRAAKREEDEDNTQREQGRRDAMGDAPAPKAAALTNQADAIVQKAIQSRRTRDYVAKQVEDDMYPEGKPRPKPASEQLVDARNAGRVSDDAYAWGWNQTPGGRSNPKKDENLAGRGYDGLMDSWINDPEETPDVQQDARHNRRLAKGYQMASHRRFAERRQLPKPGSYYGRQY